jgi:hypothetical protein
MSTHVHAHVGATNQSILHQLWDYMLISSYFIFGYNIAING